MNASEKPQVPLPAAAQEKPATPIRPVPKAPSPPELEQLYGKGPRLRDLDRDIEREMEEALGDLNPRDLLGSNPERGTQTSGEQAPTRRQKGKVLQVRGNDIFVEVPGGRSQGVMGLAQFPEGPPALGTEIEFAIEGYDGANGLLLLTRSGAAQTADWSTVAPGMVVEARVTATNKGGLSVDVNGIRGFMPISQIDLYRVEIAEPFVNQRLLCMVVEVKPSERNLVVSRRALLEKEREEASAKLWEELAEGQVREGVVRSVREFGAFVDLGGVDGLLPVSQMAWGRVKDPGDIVQPGQHLKVQVLKVDRETRRISLGLKQLLASPWDQADANYPPNAVVQGTVTRLMDFGAFVELEPGVEGLVHISELAPHRVKRVADVVQEGQTVQTRVLRVDLTQRKISLSLKQVKEAEPETTAEESSEEPQKAPKPRTTPLRGGLGE